MKTVNISEDAHTQAKVACAESRMLLSKWVEEAIAIHSGSTTRPDEHTLISDESNQSDSEVSAVSEKVDNRQNHPSHGFRKGFENRPATMPSLYEDFDERPMNTDF